ncbi:hypothetical protein DXG01_013210, partial [Tephrocybe rancida]
MRLIPSARGGAPLATTAARVVVAPLTATVTRVIPTKGSKPATAGTSHKHPEQLEDGGKDDRVKMQGQIFCAFFEIFPTFAKPGFTQRARPHKTAGEWEIQLAVDATPQQKANGVLALMIESLPKDLKSQVGGKDFEAQFLAGFSIRSQILRRMREVAPTIFLLPASCFTSKSPYPRELQALSSFNNMDSPDSENPTQHAPVLYSMEIRNQVRDHGLQESTKMQLFLGREPYLFMKAFLFGPSSLGIKRGSGTHPYGQKWGITTMAQFPFYAIPLFATL